MFCFAELDRMPNYGEWTLKQLKEELGRRSIRKVGKKADLVKRLVKYN